MGRQDEHRAVPKAALAVVAAGGRVSILDLDRLAEPPLILEGTAVEIWRLLDGRSAGEIAEELAARYGAPVEQVLASVEAFLADLAGRGILA